MTKAIDKNKSKSAIKSATPKRKAMKKSKILHTKKQADNCLKFLSKHIFHEFFPKLIGSFGKGAKESWNDIDIYVPGFVPQGKERQVRYQYAKEELKELLCTTKVEETDWGGWYFRDTIFGNVDIFFDIKRFDH